MKIPDAILIHLYADGADLQSMIQEYGKGIVKGFTTNPTLMRKAGVDNYRQFISEAVRAIPDQPISFEVFSDDLSEMAAQARLISAMGKNIYVKIPVTTTKGIFTGTIIHELSREGIRLNITAILTLKQVYEISNAIFKGSDAN